MLSPSEFTTGKVGDAKPLSLILPSTKYEETMLVGRFEEAAAAVFLSGQHRSLFFESEGNESWGGLIVQDVRIEIDEASVVDPFSADAPMLSVIRTDTRLVLAAKRQNSMWSSDEITLYDNLALARETRVAFMNWKVVLGEGHNKRVMWSSALAD